MAAHIDRNKRMRTSVDQPARLQTWIAVIAICLLAGSSLVAIVRVFAMSYASGLGGGTSSGQGAAPDGAAGATADPQSLSGAAQTSSRRQSRATCRECGVIRSIVPSERYGDVGGRERAQVRNAGNDSGRVSGSAVAAGRVGTYDVAVRFRDGSTIVLSEATPRSWRIGSRVIAIAGASTPIE
jgi:hypothetical protein